jgi:uncharacterized repeat protein (TIGR01451 family)
MHLAKPLKAALAVAVAFTLYLPLQAELKSVLVAHKIVMADGAEQKLPADKAKPGDVVEYVAEYQNTDKRPVKDVLAKLPIPSGMEYLPDTASPAEIMASTDDVNFAAVPLKRSVRGADGKMIQQLVPYSEYRSLRWNLGEIPGGASKTVQARMKIKAGK